MKFDTISVVGLGLIGGSLCAALKGSGAVNRIVGVDSKESVVIYAESRGLVDLGTTSLKEGVAGAEIVVICVYVNKIVGVAKEVLSLTDKSCVVTDVGSVKLPIVKGVETCFEGKSRFIGGHPIAGTEHQGIENSDSRMFSGKKIFITPTERTHPLAISKTKTLWEIVGGTVLEMEPLVHDKIFSYVSHLPHAVAYSLVNTVKQKSGIDKVEEYAGGGFRDFTRIASSSPEMWKTIFLMNRENLLDAIKQFKGCIEHLESLIEHEDEKALMEFLVESGYLKSR